MAAKKVTPGSITSTADAQVDRINNISNVSKAISSMQKDVDQKISETKKEVKKGDSFDKIHNSMNQTLGGLNQTIAALTSGVAKITTDTARATADVVKQYGQAISQDISFNKKSVVSMALAQTSPLYGYFVAKFVETDVFKRALNKMKVAVSQTIGAIVRPLKGRGSAKGGAGIPHMQTGGKVQAGGMAKLHAGETVVPSGGGGMDVSGLGGTLKEMLEVQKRQSLYMRSVFGVFQEAGGSKILKAMASPFTGTMKLIRMFRKTKGRYVSHLSKSGQPLQNISQNVQTLYMGLMWRLDNMLNVMIAGTEATRDLSAYITKTKYAPIPSVSSKIPAFSIARFIAKAITKPITAPLGWAAKELMGGEEGIQQSKWKKSLFKKRGLYKKEPGLIKGLWQDYGPTGRRGELGQGGERGKIARGGETAGEGIEGGWNVEKMAQLAKIQSESWGGKDGYTRPQWVVIKESSKKAKQSMIDQDNLEAIAESNERQEDAAEKARKQAKKGGFLKRIFSWVPMIIGFLGSLMKTLGLGAIAFTVGAAVGKYLDNKFKITERFQNFIDERNKLTAAIIGLVGKESKQAVDWMGKVKKGEMAPEVAFQQMQRSKRLGGVDKAKGALEERVGVLGITDMTAVKAGMQQFVQSNIGSYMEYDSKEISGLRRRWLAGTDGGGWFAKKWQQMGATHSPHAVGAELEERFHSFMVGKLKPLTAQQRATPDSYKKAYETGIKERNLSPEQVAQERIKHKKQAERMGRTEATAIDSTAGKDPAKVRENVRKKVVANMATMLAKGRHGKNLDKTKFMGQANMLWGEIIEGLPDSHPLLTDYSYLSSIAQHAVKAHEGARGFLGLSYDPSKVRNLVDSKINAYKAKAKDPASVAPAGSVDSIPGAIPQSTVVSDSVDLTTAEVKLGGKHLEAVMEKQTEQLAEATKKSTGVIITNQTQNTNNQIENSQSTNTTVGGGGGGGEYPDPASEANRNGPRK